MLSFNDWIITSDGLLGRQYDNLSRRVEVVGDLPEGWLWELLVQAGDAMDILLLEPMEGGVGHTLTAEQLSLDGYYTVQLRGRMGEMVRHTNTVQVFVPKSLSGTEKWPTIPSEFTELEQRLLALNGNPPVPSDSGYWKLWDAPLGEYVESKYPSIGPKGETGATGAQGPAGSTGPEGKQGAPGKDNLPNVAAVAGSTVTLTMDHNVEYHCDDAVTSLTIQDFTPADDGKASMWAIQFAAGDNISVTIPDNVTWAVAKPAFTAGVCYWLSFVPLVNGGILGVWVSNEQIDT